VEHIGLKSAMAYTAAWYETFTWENIAVLDACHDAKKLIWYVANSLVNKCSQGKNMEEIFQLKPL